MAYDSTTQTIIAPVDMGDIADALGVDSLDAGTLCTADEVNKWSFNKPVLHPALDEVTREQMLSIRCGLVPVSVSKLLTMIIGATTFEEYPKDECLAEIAEWGYTKPTEIFRQLDFDGYNHLAIPPDAGWGQKEIDTDTIAKLKAVTVDLSANGDYAETNFKMTPKYNGSDYLGGLYQSFGMKFGPATDENINGKSNMEIAISDVASLDGDYRIALAVWIPNFGSGGGWGIFASRMTVRQYFAESLGSGDSLRNLFPDLATNPYAASFMADYITDNNGYVAFEVVPLLIKNLWNTKINGIFCLHPVDGSTTAYCMPSGARSVSFICGTPPLTIYFRTSTDRVGNAVGAFIENTDAEASHTFGYYTTNYYPDKDPVKSSINTAEWSPGEVRQVGGAPSQAGYGITVTVVSQDGIEV